MSAGQAVRADLRTHGAAGAEVKKATNAVRPLLDRRHKALLYLMVLASTVFAAYMLYAGAGYYRLPLGERPFHPQHIDLRPSGHTGIRLGFFSGLLFFLLFLYPLRKRVRFLQQFGKTRNWLDVHAMLGLIMPLVVVFHSSLKLGGLAGMAFWIMIAIVVSGIVGRYLYAQIPRSVGAAELSLKELQDQADGLGAALKSQALFTEFEISAALLAPPRDEVESMPLWRALLVMAALDAGRPFRMARLRRKVITPLGKVLTLGGLLKSGDGELESVLSSVRRESWLTAKILFLNRAGQIFHLWHVIHRPFSYSFAALVTVHVVLVTLMGYF